MMTRNDKVPAVPRHPFDMTKPINMKQKKCRRHG